MTTYYIYKIYCNDENVTDTYIGSTKNISTRKYQHKSHCKCSNSSHHNRKVYQIIRANGGWDNWNFVVVEEIKECSKIQALIREEYYRQELKANMNAQTCFSGIIDYNTKQERQKQYDKQYCETNKHKIKERQQRYYEDTKEIKNEKFICECGGKYTKQHKADHFKRPIHQNYLANLKEVIV